MFKNLNLQRFTPLLKKALFVVINGQETHRKASFFDYV